MAAHGRVGPRLEITDYDLMQMPQVEIEQWVEGVSSLSGFRPGRRFRCEICIAAGLDPLLVKDMTFDPLLYRYRAECDPTAHADYYDQFRSAQ